MPLPPLALQSFSLLLGLATAAKSTHTHANAAASEFLTSFSLSFFSAASLPCPCAPRGLLVGYGRPFPLSRSNLLQRTLSLVLLRLFPILPNSVPNSELGGLLGQFENRKRQVIQRQRLARVVQALFHRPLFPVVRAPGRDVLRRPRHHLQRSSYLPLCPLTVALVAVEIR